MSVVTRGRPMAATLTLVALLATFVVPLAAGLPAAQAAASTPDREFILNKGHIDGFEVTYDAASGKPVLAVKDDTRIYDSGAVIRDPESTTFAYEDERAKSTLPPATGGWSFLGEYGGTEAWLSSQSGTDQTYLPWVGWSTERLTSTLVDTDVTLQPGTPVSLDVKVDGPGQVFTFMTGSFGTPINQYINTLTSAGGTIPVTGNAHVHTNWVFTAEGDYTFTVTPTLKTTTGDLVGDPGVYHFRIGERAPEPVTTNVTVTADEATYTAGQTATFTAAQDPATELSTYRWEIAAAGTDDYAPIEGATAGEYRRELAAADHGAKIRAVLLDGERVAGSSEPVTLSVSEADVPIEYAVSVTGLDDSYVEGSTIDLTAVLTPDVEGATYQWQRQTPTGTSFTNISGATAARYATSVYLAQNGTQYRVLVKDTAGGTVATSEPVTVVVTKKPFVPVELATSPVVLDKGHIDLFEMTYWQDALVLAVKDDTNLHADEAVYRTPESVTVLVDPELSRKEIKRDDLGFMGARGDFYYGLPMSQDAELPWPGWSTERFNASLPEGSTATDLRFEVDVEGPGNVATWSWDVESDVTDKYIDTSDDAPDVITTFAGAHVHSNWGFSELGTYTLTVTAKALANGTELASTPGIYTFQIGEPESEPVTTKVSVEADKTSYTDGDSARLTATQSPATDLSTYRWEIAAKDSQDFQAVAGAAAATYEHALTLADDGAKIRAVLLDGERIAGTSEPVTLRVAAKPAPGQGSEANREYVLTKGHIDGYEVTYEKASGQLVLSIKDDTRIYAPGVEFRDPADVTIAYEDARAIQTLPAAEGPWSFLGQYGGTEAWIGGQDGSDQAYLPWVGWSTERLLPTLDGTGITPAPGTPVTLKVVVHGPGDVLTFQTDSFGSPVNRYLNTITTDGGTIPVTANAHVHTNWVFTAAGDYHFEVTPTLATSGGATVTGATADYHVRVGDYVPNWNPLADAELTEANRNGLSLDAPRYELGTEAVASSASITDDQKLIAYVYSEPTYAGSPSGEANTARVTIPATVGAGQHKLALYDAASGELVGWAPFEAIRAEQNPGNGSGHGGDAQAPDEDTPRDTTPPPATEQCIPTAVTTEVATKALGGISSGHFDFGSIVENGQLVARTKDDREQPPSWVEPSSLVFRLGDAAKRTVPSGSEFSFLGSAGSTIWSIGQVQEAGIPWVGWNTQHPSLIEAASGPVTYRLDSVSGPGKLGVYATGNFGGVGAKYFGTMDGFPRSMTVELNQHVHGNWAFSEQGVYTVTVTQSVTLKAGATVSDSATLTFSVGDSSGTTTQTTYVGKTASGEDCELSAEQKAELAKTGIDTSHGLAAVTALLGAGAAFVAAARRRRTSGERL